MQTDPSIVIEPVQHTAWDDLIGIITGTFVASLGIALLKASSVVTGGTAGLSLLLTLSLHQAFAPVFLVVNLPFFALAAWKKGWKFTTRTIASVLLVSAFSSLHAHVLGALQLPAGYSAFGGNLLVGVGLLILFRHGASLGGFNIIALLAQERLGLRAGYVQLVLDSLVVVSAFGVVSPSNVAMSAAGAFVLNLSLAANHRPGRYVGY